MKSNRAIRSILVALALALLSGTCWQAGAQDNEKAPAEGALPAEGGATMGVEVVDSPAPEQRYWIAKLRRLEETMEVLIDLSEKRYYLLDELESREIGEVVERDQEGNRIVLEIEGQRVELTLRSGGWAQARVGGVRRIDSYQSLKRPELKDPDSSENRRARQKMVEMVRRRAGTDSSD